MLTLKCQIKGWKKPLYQLSYWIDWTNSDRTRACDQLLKRQFQKGSHTYDGRRILKPKFIHFVELLSHSSSFFVYVFIDFIDVGTLFLSISSTIPNFIYRTKKNAKLRKIDHDKYVFLPKLRLLIWRYRLQCFVKKIKFEKCVDWLFCLSLKKKIILDWHPSRTLLGKWRHTHLNWNHKHLVIIWL